MHPSPRRLHWRPTALKARRSEHSEGFASPPSSVVARPRPRLLGSAIGILTDAINPAAAYPLAF
jgi:hypothetical protein